MKNISDKYGTTIWIIPLLFGLLLFGACHSYQASDATLRLHDLWGLKELQGKKIAAPQGAILELYVAEQRFLLSIDKASYQGRFRAGASHLAFSKIKPALQENTSSLEKELIQTLQQAKKWKFHKRMLYFYHQGNIVARFVKID